MTYDAREKSIFSGDPVECYKFTRVATQWLFTDADQTVSIATGTFAPELISRGNLRQDQEKGAGSIEVTLEADNPFVAQFIPYLPTSIVFLVVYRFHRGDPEVFTVFNGEVSSARLDNEGQAILFCTPLTYRLGKNVPGTTYQSRCNHATYSPYCGANKNDFKLEGATTLVSGAEYTVSEFGTQPDQWLRNGWVERADGDRRFILDHVGGKITVDAPFQDFSAGESLIAYAGDERTEEVCNNKFGMLVNHLGFARIPQRNPFDGITEWNLSSGSGSRGPLMFAARR